jgi:hypothetical protein
MFLRIDAPRRLARLNFCAPCDGCDAHLFALHVFQCRELARVIGYARFQKIASSSRHWPLRGTLKQKELESAS